MLRGVVGTFLGLLLPAVSVTRLSAEPNVWAEKGEIRIAIQGDIKGTNPGVTRDGNTDTVIHHVVEALVAYREDLTIAPQLAENIDVSDDLTRYTFRLRKGLRFHNGQPVTSSDVKWSWQRMLDPATGWRCRHWYDGSAGLESRITSITTPDENTIVFQLSAPSSIFLDRVANVQCVTAILHPDSIAEDGSWKAPIATGPYKFNQWKRGEYILLDRFEGYQARSEPQDGYAGARNAYMPQVRFMIVPEAASGVASILSGGLDVLPLLPLHLQTSFERRPDVKVSGTGQLSWSVLLMQSKDPLLRNVKMRQAISHAIDAKQVAEISTFGNAKPNPSAIPVDSNFHTLAHDDWWPYDPEKAKALLAEVGYKGEPIGIMTNRKIPYMYENAIAIQAMLTAAGFTARLEVVDWATQLSAYFSGSFQLSAFGFSGRTHPNLNYDNFLGTLESGASVQWENKEMLRLLDAAGRTTDQVKQQTIYDQIHAAMKSELPIIGLYNEHTADVTRADVHGYETWLMGRPRLWGVWKQAH